MGIFKKKNKNNSNKIISLLLNYEQSMLFSSIEEIIVWTINTIKPKNITKEFNVEEIDDYNRVIVSGTNNQEIIQIKKNLDSFGIKTSIGDLESSDFSLMRKKYINYKFSNFNTAEVEKYYKEKYEKHQKIEIGSEPIILTIDDTTDDYYEGIIFIAYEQYKEWNEVINSIQKVYKMFFDYKKEPFNENLYNKYNRIFIKSNDPDQIQKIKQEFEKMMLT